MPPTLPRGLSGVPETASILGRFNFTLIGPSAASLVELVTGSKVHTEISDSVTLPASQKRTTHTAEPGGALDHCCSASSVCNGKAQGSGIFCKLDDDGMDVVRVRLHVIQEFQDSLPAQELVEGGLRCACCVFLVDPRWDMQKTVLPVLNQGLAELTFLCSAPQHKVERHRLRLVVLIHAKPGPEAAPIDAAVSGFLHKAREVFKAMHSKVQHRSVDFDDGEALFECLQSIAKDMYKCNVRSSVTRQLSWRSRQNTLTARVCSVQ